MTPGGWVSCDSVPPPLCASPAPVGEVDSTRAKTRHLPRPDGQGTKRSDPRGAPGGLGVLVCGSGVQETQPPRVTHRDGLLEDGCTASTHIARADMCRTPTPTRYPAPGGRAWMGLLDGGWGERGGGCRTDGTCFGCAEGGHGGGEGGRPAEESMSNLGQIHLQICLYRKNQSHRHHQDLLFDLARQIYQQI